jgi:hypothetical protein
LSLHTMLGNADRPYYLLYFDSCWQLLETHIEPITLAKL